MHAGQNARNDSQEVVVQILLARCEVSGYGLSLAGSEFADIAPAGSIDEGAERI
jgi:hypothetical protein